MLECAWRCGEKLASLYPQLLQRRLLCDQAAVGRGILHRSLGRDCCEGLRVKLFHALKVCGDLGRARKAHACLITSGLVSSTFLHNLLLGAYGRCGYLEDACRVFQGIIWPNVYSWNAMISGLLANGHLCDASVLFTEMPDRDVVSWNTMMSGYFSNGKLEKTIVLFVCMVRDSSLYPNSISFSCAMKACGGIGYFRLGCQLHGFAIKSGFSGDPNIEVAVLDVYVKCGAMEFAARHFELMREPDLFCWNSMILGYSKSSSLEDSLKLFIGMPEKNIVTWNTMISALLQHGCEIGALCMFIDMKREGVKPDSVSYTTILGACSSIYAIEWGCHVHAQILRLRSGVDASLGGALVDMYIKFGRLGTAKKVFDSLIDYNVVCWTCIIGGYSQFGYVEEATMLFNQMRVAELCPDEFAFITILGAYSTKSYICVGSQLHSLLFKYGYDAFTIVANVLCAMYAKHGSVCNADSIFQSIPARNIISWTTMITAYSLAGDYDSVLKLFRAMPERNLVTWNAALAAHIHNGHGEEGVKMYISMFGEASVLPDAVTFTTLLSFCADSCTLKLGSQLICQIFKFGLTSNVSVANVMITFFSKCGGILEAQDVFDSIPDKNLISWNAMIAGLGHNGFGRKAIETFENMLATNIEPDNISYISVLSACSHSGLVLEGKLYFDFMAKHQKIPPSTKHFACMVDLFGRAGLFEEAKSMITEMKTELSTEVRVALLNACKIYGNNELAKSTLEHLLELDLKYSGSYVLLANVYASLGNINAAERIRNFIKDRGIKLQPGCSWLEIRKQDLFSSG